MAKKIRFKRGDGAPPSPLLDGEPGWDHLNYVLYIGDGVTNHAIAGGTVTSVALTVPASILSVAGSPVTSSGTLALSLATQTANTVWAGPTTGSAASPTFRVLVAADVPDISATYLTVSAAAATYLTTSSAAATYLTIATAASTYLTTSAAASGYQPLDGDLTALAALNATGFARQAGAGSWSIVGETGSGSVVRATSPAITGGTINNNVIGGSTPAAGTFTNLTATGDLVVDGNLTVSGVTTTVNTATLTVEDPLILLASNNTSTDVVDVGIYGAYYGGADVRYSGLFRDATDGKWRLFRNLKDAPTTTVDTAGVGYVQATLVCHLESPSVSISGGSINGTGIGGTSPANGTFSSLTCTGDTQLGNSLTDLVALGPPLAFVGSANAADVVDVGFYGTYTPVATALFTGLFRDASDGKWKLFKSLEDQPTNTVDTAGTGYAVATLVCHLEDSSVAITGGTITGITVLTPAVGGTGVNNASRTITISSNSGTLNFTAASKTLAISLDTTLNGGTHSGTNTGDQTVPAAAAQSDQETATSTTTYVSPGRQHFHPSAVKCWLKGHDTGTAANDVSYGVTSLTDNGSGYYVANLSVTFSSVHYPVFALNNVGQARIHSTTDPTTTAIHWQNFNTVGTAANPGWFSVGALGDF